MRRINVTLSARGISSAIRELKAYKRDIERKTKLLAEKLAELGSEVAREQYANIDTITSIKGIPTEDVFDVTVSVEERNNGYAIIAAGKDVAFLEFGAGIIKNPDGAPHEWRAMVGAVGIGEWGQGQGSRTDYGWWTPEGYYSEGVVATRALHTAYEAMLEAYPRLAKEIFGG